MLLVPPNNLSSLSSNHKIRDELRNGGPYETVDVTDKAALLDVVKKYSINVIYHLAALLSARSEELPDFAWQLNLNCLKDVLDIARGISPDYN